MFKCFTPDKFLFSVTLIDLEALKAAGIKGVLFDVDNTLAIWDKDDIDPEIINWMEKLKSLELKACLISNNSWQRIEPVAKFFDIDFVARAKKPLKKGFKRALLKTNTRPMQTAMVGDQVFTDIWGGNRAGLYTILLKPIHNKEFLGTKINRFIERLVWPFIERNLDEKAEASDEFNVYL